MANCTHAAQTSSMQCTRRRREPNRPEPAVLGAPVTTPLMPCPFCGSPPVSYAVGDAYPQHGQLPRLVVCENCHCAIHGRKILMRLWNIRAPTTGRQKAEETRTSAYGDAAIAIMARDARTEICWSDEEVLSEIAESVQRRKNIVDFKSRMMDNLVKDSRFEIFFSAIPGRKRKIRCARLRGER